MRKKLITIASALALITILSAIPTMSFLSQAQTIAKIQGKSEVIYGNLDANGTINSIHVVNQFDVKEGGNITDYGNYSSVTNLTTTDPVTQDGETITFDATPGTFYYQGNLSENVLPWIVSLSYQLDGIEIDPSQLAGKSGDLTIHLTTTPNTNINPVFYENYMLQVAFSLDNDIFTDVVATGATIASAGSKLSVNFTAMPGKNADATITAKVTNFSLDGVQISGIPFSTDIDLSVTDNMLGDFSKLSDAIIDLNSGVEDLNAGALELSENATKLADGSMDIKGALGQLSSNTTGIITGSSQINDALSFIATNLNDSSGLDLSSFSTLTQTLSQMSSGIKDISKGLEELNTGFTLAYQALDQAILAIPDTIVTQEDINSLYVKVGADPELKQSLDALVSGYSSAMTVKGTYNQVKNGFSAVGSTILAVTPSLDEMALGLSTISTGLKTSISENDITTQLNELTTGLDNLSSNYKEFHKGLANYMSGVTTLSNGYSEFQSGITLYNDGMKTFAEGITTLYDGTQELKEQTSDLPEQIKEQIKETTEEYTGKDFTPVSFLSSNNSQINLVQFVMKTADIKVSENTEVAIDDQEKESFWDRLIQLFTGK